MDKQKQTNFSWKIKSHRSWSPCGGGASLRNGADSSGVREEIDGRIKTTAYRNGAELHTKCGKVEFKIAEIWRKIDSEKKSNKFGVLIFEIKTPS